MNQCDRQLWLRLSNSRPASAVGSRAKSVNFRVYCRLEIDTPRAIICNCPGSNKERT
jgi:hypothetical protein